MPTAQHAIRYAITSRAQYAETEPERRAGLIAQGLRLAADGVDFIQLREKDLPAKDLAGLAGELLNTIRRYRSSTRLLINSRPDIALAAGADGVHLPSGDDQLTPAQIRCLFSRQSDPESAAGKDPPHSARAGNIPPVVSVSCHTLEEVCRARENRADLILFGPVFGKSIAGKVIVPETGLEALRKACEAAAETPVLALGGVTAANSASAIAAGAKGIAAIRLFR